jgi:molybdenum cofactor cytidylyltransferase
MNNRNGISLARALRVERGAVVSFVGAGGKTTSMFRLATELSAAGLRIVSTTTTHISKEQVHFAPAAITLDEVDLLESRLDQYGQCLVIGPPDGKGRVFGASSELIDVLHARADVDVVLVEADGSRSLPFKAPGQHEPVVPKATTILAPVAGMNSLGQPLDEAHVHRSEIVAALAQQSLGSPITAQTLARVLSHPEGGAKYCPVRARLVPILNKTDTDAAMLPAGQAARAMLANAAVDTVVLSSMQQDSPVREAWSHTAGIVFAAGQAIRYGAAKQALPWNGETLAAHTARIALDAGLDPVIVVLGYQAESVEKSLAGLPVHPVFNSDYEAGQSTSLRKGLEALPARTGAAVFLLADQPLITADILRTIVQAHRQSFAPACVPVFEGLRGNPVLFDKALFRELKEMRGDTGGRELLDKYASAVVAVPSDYAVLLDIDTPEENERQNSEFRSQNSGARS